MAPRSRVVSGQSTSSHSSSGSHGAGAGAGQHPARPPAESPIEVAYNTAVQAFVRRDHVKTHAALRTLLELVGDRPLEEKEWRIKVLKLVISAHASIYSDPPITGASLDDLPDQLRALLPPAAPPSKILEHVYDTCRKTLSIPPGGQLPPALVSTLMLASLKLKPSGSALDFAHRTAETWLAAFEFPSVGLDRKENEGLREGYLKVVELFIGEVLAREGEYGMARAFLDGDDVLGSKRKETLYRHLRASENRANSAKTASSASTSSGPSPSSSGLLPTPSPSAPLVLPPRGSRSRSSSTSSSSSERTARPNLPTVNGNGSIPPIPFPAKRSVKGKGKEKETRQADADLDGQSADTNSTYPTPKQIYVNPGGGSSSRRPTAKSNNALSSSRNTLLDLIPPAMRQRLTSPWFVLSLVLPVPLAMLFGALIWRRRRRVSVVAAAGHLAGGGARGGLRAWLAYWLRWWIAKFIGVIKMGTTLTYL